jgi:hypothetical protein
VVGDPGMGQLLFIDAEKKLVFSEDHPEAPGEVLEHQVLGQVSRTHEIAHGMELESDGRFLLRVVAPWVVSGESVGYVEMTQDISL